MKPRAYVMNMTVICMVPVRFSPQFDGALAMKADSRIARGVVETAEIGAERVG